jgi:hypothetical protein
MNWGKGLSNEMQRAVAMYCRQNLLDPTEINVLGGNIYRNASYYLRRLSEMLDDGVIEYAKLDHVNYDARLEKLAKGTDDDAAKARAELRRREGERIALNIPDAAAAAVIFRVKLKGMDLEFTGAKWCGGGTRKSDPVGDSFPVETAETRAVRRCMRFIASQLPHLKWREEELDDRAAEVSARIADEREAAKLLESRHPRLAAHYTQGPAMANQASGFMYPEDQPIVTGGEILDEPSPAAEAASAAEPAKADDFQDDRDLVEEPQRGTPAGSLSHRVPKPGRIQDALELNDQPKRGRNAIAEP